MGKEVVCELAEPPTYGMYYIASPLCSDPAEASKQKKHF